MVTPSVDKALEMLYHGAFVSKDYEEVIRGAYNQPWRHYHTLQHIEEVLSYLFAHKMWQNQPEHNGGLVLAALFHDIVYDPMAKDNEEKSVEMLLSMLEPNFHSTGIVKSAVEAILATKTHEVPTDSKYKDMIKVFLDADLDLLLNYTTSTKRVIENEMQIFKEYQSVPWNTYRSERIKVLNKFKSVCAHGTINLRIGFLEAWEPRIGLFTGSFNPFHKGHLDVLKKAEKLFDKVIIAKGQNVAKNSTDDIALPNEILNHQVEYYPDLVTNLIKRLGHSVILVRGVRNERDASYEMEQIKWIQEFDPSQQTVLIPCEPSLAHVSSSALRTVAHYNADDVLRRYLL